MFCSQDSNCKGFVGVGNDKCQLATTSQCDHAPGGTKHDIGTEGDLMASCGGGYGGCYVKKSPGMKEVLCIVSNLHCYKSHDRYDKFIFFAFKVMFNTILESSEVSRIFCSPTYIGGCENWSNNRLEEHKDRQYTVEECYSLCSEHASCSGFFLHTPTKGCALYKNGCIKSDQPDYTYYSLDDCKFGINK